MHMWSSHTIQERLQKDLAMLECGLYCGPRRDKVGPLPRDGLSFPLPFPGMGISAGRPSLVGSRVPHSWTGFMELECGRQTSDPEISMAVRGDSMIHSMISAVLHVAAGSSVQRLPSSDALKKSLITAQDSGVRLQVGIAFGCL